MLPIASLSRDLCRLCVLEGSTQYVRPIHTGAQSIGVFYENPDRSPYLSSDVVREDTHGRAKDQSPTFAGHHTDRTGLGPS